MHDLLKTSGSLWGEKQTQHETIRKNSDPEDDTERELLGFMPKLHLGNIGTRPSSQKTHEMKSIFRSSPPILFCSSFVPSVKKKSCYAEKAIDPHDDRMELVLNDKVEKGEEKTPCQRECERVLLVTSCDQLMSI